MYFWIFTTDSLCLVKLTWDTYTHTEMNMRDLSQTMRKCAHLVCWNSTATDLKRAETGFIFNLSTDCNN